MGARLAVRAGWQLRDGRRAGAWRRIASGAGGFAIVSGGCLILTAHRDWYHGARTLVSGANAA